MISTTPALALGVRGEFSAERRGFFPSTLIYTNRLKNVTLGDFPNRRGYELMEDVIDLAEWAG